MPDDRASYLQFLHDAGVLTPEEREEHVRLNRPKFLAMWNDHVERRRKQREEQHEANLKEASNQRLLAMRCRQVGLFDFAVKHEEIALFLENGGDPYEFSYRSLWGWGEHELREAEASENAKVHERQRQHQRLTGAGGKKKK